MKKAEWCLTQKELVVAVAVGRAGLGYFQRTQVIKAWGRAVEQSSRPLAAWSMVQVVFLHLSVTSFSWCMPHLQPSKPSHLGKDTLLPALLWMRLIEISHRQLLKSSGRWLLSLVIGGYGESNVSH